ncbi:hypothetical protein FC07_GL002495 [Loigolactobacillus bifermentans DSM 20003]|uniref:Large ribosomal subunit protein bL28 n=1 Tax=Loigolactobacillus bifermentans DSM 20003 TaxID=1423726 RepID=A0A0R1HAS8_9LACO|nr:hypothetical protein FC07_GL002495 [Loigolactobacillus bifermentans DSM 20003]
MTFKSNGKGGIFVAKDYLTGQGTTFGNKRSHALNHSRRSWKANLQKVRILVDGKPKRVWVSARTLKSGKVTRV